MYKIMYGLKYCFLSITAFICLFPFLWMLIGATNQSVDIIKGNLFPGTYLIENIKNVFAGSNIGIGIVNSTVITLIITVVSLVVSSLAGYAFEIYASKARDRVMGILLLSMMIPFAAIMIPLYQLFGSINLLDSFWSIILPSIATPFLIFFFRQSTKAFPKDMIQAARVDGLSELMIFFKIYMPSMRSAYAAAAVITFMNTWNNYMWPLIALQSPNKQTLPIVVSSIGSSSIPDYGMVMVSIVIATIPAAIIFFGLQKSFVEGMVGSVK